MVVVIEFQLWNLESVAVEVSLVTLICWYLSKNQPKSFKFPFLMLFACDFTPVFLPEAETTYASWTFKFTTMSMSSDSKETEHQACSYPSCQRSFRTAFGLRKHQRLVHKGWDPNDNKGTRKAILHCISGCSDNKYSAQPSSTPLCGCILRRSEFRPCVLEQHSTVNL